MIICIGRHLKNTNEHIIDVEYSPLLGGFVAVLSGGRGFFLSAPHARFDLQVSSHYYESTYNLNLNASGNL